MANLYNVAHNCSIFIPWYFKVASHQGNPKYGVAAFIIMSHAVCCKVMCELAVHQSCIPYFAVMSISAREYGQFA